MARNCTDKIMVDQLHIIREGYSILHSDKCLVSIVTQLSIDRIDRLQLLCCAWASSNEICCEVVAAVLDEDRSKDAIKPSHNSSIAALKRLEDDVRHKMSNCILHTILVARSDNKVGVLYPINQLRNIALKATLSEFIFLLDVDCIPTTGILHELIGTPERLTTLRRICWDECAAVVIPCFEFINPLSESQSRRHNYSVKDIYSGMIDKNNTTVQRFMGNRFPRGHRASNYSQLEQIWTERLNQTHTSKEGDTYCYPLSFYKVEYEEGYEPYIILPRVYACMYDEVFSGYGRNKTLQLYHLHRMGVQYYCCGNAAVIHIDHAPSVDRQLLLGPVEPAATTDTGNCSPGDFLRIEKLPGLLEEIKDKYNVARQAITTHCSSWAIEGVHQNSNINVLLNSEYYMDDNDYTSNSSWTNCLPRYRFHTWLGGNKKSHMVYKTKRSYGVGTACAWWPDAGTQSAAEEVVQQLRALQECEYTEGSKKINIENIEISSVRHRLAHLCSMHMRYEAPLLHIHRHYESAALNTALYREKASIWLVTHCSVDRIDKLRALCRCWQGPLAAAVWIQPFLSYTQHKQAVLQINQLVYDVKVNIDQSYQCDLKLVQVENLYVDSQFLRKGVVNSRVSAYRRERSQYGRVRCSKESPLSAQLYPINALRGAAMDIVQEHCLSACAGNDSSCGGSNSSSSANSGGVEQHSDVCVVFMVDVDMRPSDLLCSALSSTAVQNSVADPHSLTATVLQACAMKQFVVFPALEITESEETDQPKAAAENIHNVLHAESVQELTSLLAELHNNSCIQAFHASTYPPGHNATDTTAWLANAMYNQVNDSNCLRIVQHEEGWEPYGLASLSSYLLTGGVNRCYVGWHKDKIDIIRRFAVYGVGFAVCTDPRAFVLDWQPHDPVAGRVCTGVESMYVYAAMEGLYNRHSRQLYALQELSAEEAFKDPLPSTTSTAALDLQSNTTATATPMSLLLSPTNRVTHTIHSSTKLLNPMLFWETNSTIKVLANPAGLANITESPQLSGVYRISLSTGTLSPPLGGVSFTMQRIQENQKSLYLRYKIRFPNHFPWISGGCLPGFSGFYQQPQYLSDGFYKLMNFPYEYRGRWNEKGLFFTSIKDDHMLIDSLTVDYSQKVQLFTSVWHEIEMICEKGLFAARVDGQVVYCASVRETTSSNNSNSSGSRADVMVLCPQAVRVCVFVCDNTTTVATTTSTSTTTSSSSTIQQETAYIELQDIDIAESAVEIEGVGGVGEGSTDQQTATAAAVIVDNTQQHSFEQGHSNINLSITMFSVEQAEYIISTEVTVMFAPKEVQSLGPASLKAFLQDYSTVAHLIIVLAPPFPVELEKELRDVVQCFYRGSSCIFHAAQPFQNPYEVRNHLVEELHIQTKYTLHINNDILPYNVSSSTGSSSSCDSDNGINGCNKWLVELIKHAELHPNSWAVMPLLLEKNSERLGLHVWWDRTALSQQSETALSPHSEVALSTDSKDFSFNDKITKQFQFYAKFNNELLHAPVSDLPKLLQEKLEQSPLLMLEDHCILVQTSKFPSCSPLFDPYICYRREFFDLIWQIRLNGGDVTMALNSIVIYEKVQPLHVADIPYFLHRRQDEICLKSQEYLSYKWHIKYRTDCWHEKQRREALQGLDLSASTSVELKDDQIKLTLLVCFLVSIGGNRFMIHNNNDNISCISSSTYTPQCNLEEIMPFISTYLSNLQSEAETTLYFTQVKVSEFSFPKQSAECRSLLGVTGVELIPDVEMKALHSLPESDAYTDYTLLCATITTTSSSGSNTEYWKKLSVQHPVLARLFSLVLRYSAPIDASPTLPTAEMAKNTYNTQSKCILRGYIWLPTQLSQPDESVVRNSLQEVLCGKGLDLVVTKVLELGGIPVRARVCDSANPVMFKLESWKFHPLTMCMIQKLLQEQ